MDPEAHSGNAVRVSTEGFDLLAMLTESSRRLEEMRGRGLAYGKSSLEMNDVGLLGEYAVYSYLAGQLDDVERIGDNKTSINFAAGDLEVGISRRQGAITLRRRIGIEVKTNRSRDWERYGRTLNASQLQRLRADVIVWCVTEDELPGASVSLMGWLPTEFVRRSESNQAVVVNGYSGIRVREPMKPPASLANWICTQEISGL